MTIHATNAHALDDTGAFDPSFAPCMVVNPGETLPQAIKRHRNETGHRGPVVVVGWNRGHRSAPRYLI